MNFYFFKKYIIKKKKLVTQGSVVGHKTNAHGGPSLDRW
jgi:hypothetical protein